MRTFYKLGVVLVNRYVGKDVVLRLIGYFNRRFRFMNTVFVAYPATEEFTKAYGFERTLHLSKWNPWITGLFVQNGKVGLMTCVTNLEHEFLSTGSSERLKNLVAETERIRQLVGASQKTFAGILPGVLYAKRMVTDTHETSVTVEAVARAVDNVLNISGYPQEAPIIILGGMGFVGKRLVRRLNGREIHSVDLHNNDSFPVSLKGTKALIVNVSRKEALRDYMKYFWKELITLNEVYPPPHDTELTMISEIRCPLYHIVGVDAKAYPSFPSVYKGGIPCCAAWNAGADMKVVVRRLV